MSAPIQIQITTNAQKILRELEAFPPEMLQAIAAALDQQNEGTIGSIRSRKLSRRGPTTLGVRSGRLWQSMSKANAQIAGNTVVSSIGSNVRYAGVHEFGFTGTVQVKAHRRRLIAFDRYERRGRGFVQVASGLPGQIRAHPRKMNIPARAYIRTTIDERSLAYTRAIGRAIVVAWEQGNS